MPSKMVLQLMFVFALFLSACGDSDRTSNSTEGATADGGTSGDAGIGFVAHYYTSWSEAHVHFKAGSSAWTTPPGPSMEPEGDGWFVFRYQRPVSKVELVFNDGKDMWDNNGDQNYQTELHEFWIKDGIVHDQKPEGMAPPTTMFCKDALCGQGTCNEAEQRCDCNTGYLYDPNAKTCSEDKCAGVTCGFGGLCAPDTGKCLDACTPDKKVGDFSFCTQSTTSSVAAIVKYTGSEELDLTASTVRLNEKKLEAKNIEQDAATKAIAVRATGLEPSKYSYLFRMKTKSGKDVRPLFLPTWVGSGMRYADFSWKDGIMYQVMTDRFLDGDASNNLDNTKGTLAEVTDKRSQWQGGDFRGLIKKLKDGYFTEMGITALWISSPLLNSHQSQPAVELKDPLKYASYHSYHPIVTGYTHLDNLGYANPIEPAFGTEAELHELVNEAHRRGIRVIPDFVANHVQIEAALYTKHKDWFSAYNPCDGNWDAHRLECWFTTKMPDFDYSKQDAVDTVVKHAIWLVEEYNFDGFRADALKHMNDGFVRALKKAVVEEIETTVNNHELSEEPTVFYMVGESLGGWARYHVREDMVQGQVDEGFYYATKNALLSYEGNLKSLADFAIKNDTAYLTPQDTMGGQGGYAGAVMGNFFGNHDQVRALTEAKGDYARLKLAQTFLMTSPGNIPMLYQGDDIGTLGGKDPENRKMQRFEGLSAAELSALDNVKKVGKLREQHKALRRGTRSTVTAEEYFWVYQVTAEDDEVYVAINRDGEKSYQPPSGYSDALGICNGGKVPSQSACVFVKR